MANNSHQTAPTQFAEADGISYAYRYTTEPASLLLPGVETEEIDGWTEDGKKFRRLAVTYPASIASHTPRQVLYVDGNGLIRRRDYTVDIAGKAPSAQYATEFATVDGLVVATSRIGQLRGDLGGLQALGHPPRAHHSAGRQIPASFRQDRFLSWPG